MNEQIISTIKSGGLVVMPTDTIYGLVASALNPEAIARLKKIKGRADDKPFIVLIANQADLEKFGVKPTPAQQQKLDRLWPGAASVILAGQAFRLPAEEKLRQLLRATGPLAAPSANPADLPPATTIDEARAYFGDQVDLYLDGGKIVGQPSTLLALDAAGKITLLRGTL